MKTMNVDINGKQGLGVEVPFNKAPLVLVKGSKGFVMCGFLNVAVAEKLGEAAAMVRGVKTIQDLLEAKIVEATTPAAQLGVAVGMTGRQALEHLL
jgi:uncharacterized protein YunC (DUF1805 family)